MDAQKFLDEYGPLLTTWAGRIVGVVILFIVAWMIASWSRGALRRTLEKRSFDATLTKFFSNTLRWLILLAAGIASLGVFGVETTSFAAVLGAMGLAIGLAFQGSLSNVASGVMLLIFRPFKVGDVVKVAGVIGKIDTIDLLVTTMDTPDNRRIILPNSTIFGATIENATYHPVRRVDLAVGVAYSADLDHVRKTLEEIAATIPDQPADKPSQVVITDLGESSVNWVIRVWTKTEDYFAVLEKLTDTTKKKLDDAEIGIPFPNRELQAGDSLAALFRSGVQKAA